MLSEKRLTPSGGSDQAMPEVWSDDLSNCILTKSLNPRIDRIFIRVFASKGTCIPKSMCSVDRTNGKRRSWYAPPLVVHPPIQVLGVTYVRRRSHVHHRRLRALRPHRYATLLRAVRWHGDPLRGMCATRWRVPLRVVLLWV